MSIENPPKVNMAALVNPLNNALGFRTPLVLKTEKERKEICMRPPASVAGGLNCLFV